MNAQQAKSYHKYKNTKLKLLKTVAAIWYNKMCRTKQVKPNYINIKTNGRTQQDKKTISNAIKFRTNQEIKFLYQKKQHLNQQLYRTHLQCAHEYAGMWQHIYENIDLQLNKIMEAQYTKLNNKLDKLLFQKTNHPNSNKQNNQNNSRVINLTNIKLTHEQLHTLSFGPNFAIEKAPEKIINELIIDTETAIKKLEPKQQGTYRYLAAKQIKYIMNNYRNNTAHKRNQYIINKIKTLLQQNNLSIVKADKSKTIVLIDKNSLEEKIKSFMQENKITQLTKDPTEKYHKHIQQTIKQCSTLIDKHNQKYLTNIKPKAPKLNVCLKTHKEGTPIRPIVNNTQAPSYKIAKFLNKKLNHLINLPHTYNLRNSQQLAEELINLQVDSNTKMITYDIKDLYVNLPIQGIITTTEFWLNRSNTDKKLITEIIQVLTTIVNQNYFQHENMWFQPEKGVAMGSPISSTIAEIFLQHIEHTTIKHWLESEEIIYYRRYVDDILIIYKGNITNEHKISQHMNNVNKHLQFKPTSEQNQTINYLDLTIHRKNNNLDLSIYRKPTNTDICIHQLSNHPNEHKTAAFRYYIHRMETLPITKEAKQKEWKTIITTAKNNGYSKHWLNKIRNKTTNRTQNTQPATPNKKWITLKYFSPAIRRISNLFKDTNLKIAFKPYNTIQQQLNKTTHDRNPSGIYKLQCNTCKDVYIGQSGRDIHTRYKEHIRYIRTNNNTSAYATHILNNRHEYGTASDTIQLLKECSKGTRMNCWEAMYIQAYHQEGALIAEQQITEYNPLFDLRNFQPTTQTHNS